MGVCYLLCRVDEEKSRRIMHKDEHVIYAHTMAKRPCSDWEPLYGSDSHSERVEKCLREFSPVFSSPIDAQMAPYLSALGMVHDMGKASVEFQNYLMSSTSGERVSSVDHKTAGAKWALENCGPMGKLMAYAVYGHHSGLPKGVSLFDALRDYEYPLGVLESLPDIVPPSGAPPLLGKECESGEELAYQMMLAVRMLHSCLVDADWLATESFVNPAVSENREGTRRNTIAQLSDKLESYLQNKERAGVRKIDELRREIHHSCYNASPQLPGVFKLNVPTGGGKTLSSLSFALAHACRHKLNRVIYVIPFTSIIEQTAQVFRDVLGSENVVEHHSNIDTGDETEATRLAAENWDAPVIVTTTVQFFESLYAAGNKKCRKLHNIGRSVVIFDEVQSLPSHLLSPCIYAMKALQRLCGCSLVLCTATQPAFEYRKQFFEIGWKSEDLHSLIGESLERRLALEMKRVKVEELGELTKRELLNHFVATGYHSALFIVNLTRQARELFELFSGAGYGNVYHLSALMCAKHRAETLKQVKECLAQGAPTILIATRVVEAGVDISFHVVYRDVCGLDSLAQAAGRCNRNGEIPVGYVYSFCDRESPIPNTMEDLRDGIYAADDVNATMPDTDTFHPNRVQRYFQLFYSKRKTVTGKWDKACIGEKIGTYTRKLETWNFPEIEMKFKLISDVQRAIIICYGTEAEDLRKRLLTLGRMGYSPSQRDYRLLQQYLVNVYKNEWEILYPHLERVHEVADIWMLRMSEYYSEKTGLIMKKEPLNYIC